MNLPLFVSAPRGMEYLLGEEAAQLGLSLSRTSPQGVFGEGSLETAYRLCLWSRLANRVHLVLFSGRVTDEKSLYALCREYAWQDVFTADKSLCVEFHGSSDTLRNTLFGAQVVKDAIVDCFRDTAGARPDVSRVMPDVRLHAHLKKDTLTVSLDLTGYSLHQRGYRLEAGEAPLRENVAAALLVRAGWPKMLETDASFCDPFCGSGTLVIEAALMAGRRAPGLLRDTQAFRHWKGHDEALWQRLREEAQAAALPITRVLQGSDNDPRAIAQAQANAERAGVAGDVEFSVGGFETSRARSTCGLVATNPPFGVRLQDQTTLVPMYRAFGQHLHAAFQGHVAAILSPDPLLARALGLRVGKQYALANGALACTLWCLTLDATNRLKETGESGLTEGAQMLANRLAKNLKHLKKWVQREGIECYRLYDADLPEYAFAIDCYGTHVVAQEYAAPASIPPHKAERRRLDMLEALVHVLGVSRERLVMRERRVQKGTNQYQKLAQTGQSLVVREGAAQFKVNLTDYLDTGLFLDHRPLRLRFATLKRGTRFLNLFCYTGTASVHAALAGAITTNVDMSRTYLRWAEDNFALNKLPVNRHQFVQYDCREWLKRADDRFDVIFLDPPSFSNSKRMDGTLDIVRDHAELIDDAMRLLTRSGTLYFSTNARHFRMEERVLARYQVEDITASTLDMDFQRNARIHTCFRISHPHESS